jgi:hypothetical protein
MSRSRQALDAYQGRESRPRTVGGWVMVGGGIICCLFAEIWLVESSYYAFDVASRRWLGIAVLIPIAAAALLTSVAVARAFRRRREHSVRLSFFRLGALCLGIGFVEIVVSVLVAVVVLVVLAGGPQHFPVVNTP